MHDKHDLRRDADESHHHFKPHPEKPARRTHAQQFKRGVKQRPKPCSR
jgi:hypothetical protein